MSVRPWKSEGSSRVHAHLVAHLATLNSNQLGAQHSERDFPVGPSN